MILNISKHGESQKVGAKVQKQDEGLQAMLGMLGMGSSDADQPDVEPPSLATTAGETEAPLIELIYPDGWCGLGPRVPQLPAGAGPSTTSSSAPSGQLLRLRGP